MPYQGETIITDFGRCVVVQFSSGKFYLSVVLGMPMSN